MISKLTGVLDAVEESQIIIDVGGVGYEVFCSSFTISSLPNLGSKVTLLIRSHVREDHFHLYGFISPKEKVLFDYLIKVQGVGNKLALVILSKLNCDQLINAMINKDKSSFASVSGVGPKLASRLAIELESKVSQIQKLFSNEIDIIQSNNNALLNDVVSALMNLGYKRNEVNLIASRVIKDDKGSSSIDSIIRETLRELSVNV